MSAAEKLKALLVVTSDPESYGPSMFPPAEADKAVAVLPQIVAVVEAAEAFHAHQRWAEAKGIKGHPPACGPKDKKALSVAVAALDEALT